MHHDVPDQTSGSPVREARPLMERLLVFDLPAEIARLREEPTFEGKDRNSMTLAKESDFRLLLTVLRPGAALEEQDGEGRMSVQLLDGAATLELPGGTADLRAGQVATVDAGNPWSLRARDDSAVLVTMAAPSRENIERGS